MSGVVNVLALTGSFFMLQVYDRVVPGRSVPTLVGLAVLAGTLVRFSGGAGTDPLAAHGAAGAGVWTHS